MSRYVRKTRDVYELRANYGYGHGFETVCAEESRREINARRREYAENEPGIPLRIVKVREPIEGANHG